MQVAHGESTCLESSRALDFSCPEDRRRRFGWGPFRPDCLQGANSAPCLLVVLSLASVILGMVHMGFVNVSLTTIEKRYHMKSEDTGIIAGAFNIAFCVMCLPIAYLASQPGASRSRWIGGGMLMVAAGSLVYATPHFLGPTYDVTAGSDYNGSRALCVQKSRMGEPVVPAGWDFNVFYLFLFAQVVMGTGCVPLVVLGVAFIDSSVSKRRSSLFIGIFGAMMVTGAALGFALGSFLLTYYIDWPTVEPEVIGLSPANDLWLGCWWLGFVVAAVAAALVAVPLLAFPASIPKSLKDVMEDVPKSQEDKDEGPPKFTNVLTNVTFMGLACGEIFPSLLGAGFGAFMPKVVESQFSLSASTAALLVGVTGVPSGFLGSVFGGCLLQKLNLATRQILHVCLWGSVLLVFSSFSFLIYCPNAPFAGVTVPYHNSSLVEGAPELVATCNHECGCQGVAYNPVCGSDDVIYYSPCHAGCAFVEKHLGLDKKVYGECRCVSHKPHEFPFSHHRDTQYSYDLLPFFDEGTKRYINNQDTKGYINNEDTKGYINNEDTRRYKTNEGAPEGISALHITEVPVVGVPAEGVAFQDKCPAPCTGLLILFFAMFFVVIFCTFALNIASQSAALRCVQENERDIAFALRSQLTRALGGITGPVLFGLFLDRSCLLWERLEDGEQGSCVLYEHFSMDRTLLYISLAVRGTAVFFYIVAVLGHRR